MMNKTKNFVLYLGQIKCEIGDGDNNQFCR